MKNERISFCNYCQKKIIEGINDVTNCIVKRQRPSTKNYPENLNLETKDLFYHQECYKEKHYIIENISDLRKMVRKTMMTVQKAPKGAFGGEK